MSWKQFGFFQEGFDRTKTIKRGDEGFLFLCQQLRRDQRLDGWHSYDLKHKPGTPGGSVSYDWTGLDEAIMRARLPLAPPPAAIRFTPRTLSADELTQHGRRSHTHWLAVRHEQRARGAEVPDDDLRPWEDLSAAEQSVFKMGGAKLAVSEEMMWDGLAQLRKAMGEKAFRAKMFELSVSVAIELLGHDWDKLKRDNATRVIVGLSEMLEVPADVVPA